MHLLPHAMERAIENKSREHERSLVHCLNPTVLSHAQQFTGIWPKLMHTSLHDPPASLPSNLHRGRGATCWSSTLLL